MRMNKLTLIWFYTVSLHTQNRRTRAPYIRTNSDDAKIAIGLVHRFLSVRSISIEREYYWLRLNTPILFKVRMRTVLCSGEKTSSSAQLQSESIL